MKVNLEIFGWIKVDSKEKMDNLFKDIYSFHDGVLKEFHIINRGFVDKDLSMIMGHSLDGTLLLQSQWEPGAINLLLLDITYLEIGSGLEYYYGGGVYNEVIDNKTIPIYIFANDLKIHSNYLYYKITSEMMGNKAFLGPAIPSLSLINASIFENDWRECSNCGNIWQEDINIKHSNCPNCWRETWLLETDTDNFS